MAQATTTPKDGSAEKATPKPKDGSADKAAPKPKESIKETIESILVAFILAFVFRAYVVEAFVIPSGSMATTLLGGHMRFTCDDCGYEFTLNYPARGADVNIPSMAGPLKVGGPNSSQILPSVTFSAHCPNCGQPVPTKTATNCPVYYGDRILVLKYDYLLHEPTRWDVVVFKAPVSPQEAPNDISYSTNFIKRLIGKPGESIMLLDGDVYVADSPEAATSAWQVQTKPKVVQDALWRVVYDHDFLPAGAAAGTFTLPWRAAQGTGWNVTPTSRTITFDNASGEGAIRFDKDSNTKQRSAFYFRDWLPYNESGQLYPVGIQDPGEADPFRDNDRPKLRSDPRISSWYVSDLKAQFSYTRKTGDGPLRVELGKLGSVFTGELLADHVRLFRRDGAGAEVELASAPLPPASGPRRVEFSNVDYRVSMRVDGQELLATTPAQYHPNLSDLLARHAARQKAHTRTEDGREEARSAFGVPTARLVAAQQTCTIEHLSLWRDVYYTPGQTLDGGGLYTGSPETPVNLARRGSAPGVDDEYFVLGDNSILSGDARTWPSPIHSSLYSMEGLATDRGRVPGRFLLGKAFFVYWPAGYRPFTPDAFGVVPNVGAMRFIH